MLQEVLLLKEGLVHIPVIFLLVFSPLIEGGTTYLPVAIISLTTSFIGAYWIRQSFINGRFIFPGTKFTAPILVFLFLSILTTLWSPYKNISIRWLMLIAAYIILFYLTLYSINSVARIRSIFNLLLIMGTFQSVLGIIQYLWFGSNRATGTFFNPNFLAGYLSATFLLGLGLFLNNREDRRLKIILTFSLPLMLIALFFTQSRGGFFSLFIGLFFVLFYCLKKKGVLIYLIILLSIILMPNPFIQRLKALNTSDSYAYSRIQIWRSSLPRIIESPLGVGLGIYKYTSQRYSFPIEEAVARYAKKAETAHNEYLQIAVELGVLGFLTFLWGITLLVKEGLSIVRSLKTDRSNQSTGGAIGLLGGVIAIFSHGLVDSNLHEPSIVILLITLTGIIIAINKTYNTDRDQVFIIKKIKGKFYDISFIIIVILLSILTIRPCMAYYAHSYGEEYMKKADLNKAAELFRWAILFDPGNTSYHYSLSAATFNKFQKDKDPSLIDETISEINYAMKLNPINTLFPSRLAFVYQYLGMTSKDSLAKERLLIEAEKNYKISIGLAPFYAPNYAGLAEIYLVLGDKEQAKMELMKAIDFEPRFLPARYQLAVIYQGEGKIELAEAEYRAIIEIKETYASKVQHVMEEEYLGVDIADVKKRLGLLKSR